MCANLYQHSHHLWSFITKSFINNKVNLRYQIQHQQNIWKLHHRIHYKLYLHCDVLHQQQTIMILCPHHCTILYPFPNSFRLPVVRLGIRIHLDSSSVTTFLGTGTVLRIIPKSTSISLTFSPYSGRIIPKHNQRLQIPLHNTNIKPPGKMNGWWGQ